VQGRFINPEQLGRDSALGWGRHIGHALEGAILNDGARMGHEGRADELGTPLGKGPEGLLKLLPLRQIGAYDFRDML
jgi:hypothetical protein